MPDILGRRDTAAMTPMQRGYLALDLQASFMRQRNMASLVLYLLEAPEATYPGPDRGVAFERGQRLPRISMTMRIQLEMEAKASRYGIMASVAAHKAYWEGLLHRIAVHNGFRYH